MEAAVGPVANPSHISVLHRIEVDGLDKQFAGPVKKREREKEYPPSIAGRRYRDINGLWHGCKARKMAAEVYFRGLGKSPTILRRNSAHMALIEQPTACAKSP